MLGAWSFSDAGTIGSYPNAGTLASNDLFIVERGPGVGDYNIQAYQLYQAISLFGLAASNLVDGPLPPAVLPSSATFSNLTATSTLTASNASIGTMTITNLQVVGLDIATNLFPGGTYFLLGTNSTTTTSSDVDFVSISNTPSGAGTERIGQLLILASGTINVTNPVSWKTSDYVDTRKLTNGNSMTVRVDVQDGVVTNATFTQFH